MVIINENVTKHKRLSIIKFNLKDKKYHVKQEMESGREFSKLFRLKNETLVILSLTDAFNEDIIFYKKKVNSYFPGYSVNYQGHSKYIFQPTNNEIVYSEVGDKITVYDFVNKLSKINFDIYTKFNLFLGEKYEAEIISENLLYIVKGKNQCFIFNFREEKMVDNFKSDKKINFLYSIKGKYFFIVKENCIRQYKVEKDNLNLIFELKTSNVYN